MMVLDQIHQMPLRENLFIMEALWEDISTSPREIEVPQWHKGILNEREDLIREGKANFIDWETAKQEIKKAVHETTLS